MTGLTRATLADYSGKELEAMLAPAPWARVWWHDGTWHYELLWSLRVQYRVDFEGAGSSRLAVAEPLRILTGTLGADAASAGFETRADYRGELDWRDRVQLAAVLHGAVGELLHRDALIAAYLGTPDH